MIRLLLSLLLVSLTAQFVSAAAPDYDRDVRSILAQKCFSCHGQDAAKREAGLRLDQRSAAIAQLESGHRAIVPGNLGASALWQRVQSLEDEVRMPPPAAKNPLTTAEKRVLRAWIEGGARFDDHWAFSPPTAGSVPFTRDDTWSRNEVDRFVVAKLREHKMQPSPPANRITLIRRLSLDLRGLPPTVAEVDAFVNDLSPTAYENLVDRLLKSKHYGEKMAQAWLDLARYGDTNGYHADSDRDMWLYRDYVIRAFNRNTPFDRFIVENLAGDLLKNATPETRIASGFNRCNTFNEEGGADPDEFYVAYAVDRANTTARVFLGMTFECAQCHDHKYDPISQREYYSFYAFFNSVEGEIGAGGPSGYHSKPLPPLLKVKTPAFLSRLDHLNERIAVASAELKGLQREYEQPSAAFRAAQTSWEASLQGEQGAVNHVEDGLVLWLSADDLNGNRVNDAKESSTASTVTAWKDRSRHQLQAQATGTIELQQQALGGLPALRLDGKEDFLRTAGGAEHLRGDFTMFVVHQHQNLAAHQMILMWGEEATGKRRAMWKMADSNLLSFNGYARDVIGKQKLTSTRPHIAVVTKQGGDNNVKFFLDGHPGGQGKVALLPFENRAITIGANNAGQEKTAALVAEVLVYSRALSEAEHRQVGSYLASRYGMQTSYSAAPSEILALAKTEPKSRSAKQTQQLRTYFTRHVYPESRQRFGKLESALQAAKQQRASAEKSVPTTMVMVEKKQRNPAYVLMRGDFQQPGEQVSPDVPGVFPRLPDNQPRNRLGLAHWLCNPQHPLTARVVVNRIWKQLLGLGLVKTMGDFGTQGERPSHAQLLDWLAVRFVQSGWDVKALQKRIVMSATYRQSSVNQERYQEQDPYNRLLSRAPRFRLSAEEIRDVALAASGLLVSDLGGPSVRPYQPTGYFADKIGRTWNQSTGRDLYRRGLYTYWRRTTPYPTFQIFDAPSREVCTADRPRTNTPLQALVLLNDPTFVEAARRFAERVLHGAETDDEARIRYGFRLAVARHPSPQELQVLRSVIDDQRQVYAADTDAAKKLITSTGQKMSNTADPVELASWTQFCAVLLNLDETITRE